MSRILVVDDEKEIADLIGLYLENEGYEVRKFYKGKEALECIEKEQLELAVLDIMLPDIDGLTLCRAIRKERRYPVIMLTAKDQEIDMINGLSIGADDYMTKPFRPLELVARVKAQLRRAFLYNSGNPEAISGQEIAVKGLVINRELHECRLNEKKLSLTPTEFELLWILCRNRGQVISSEELFRQVWKEEYYSGNNTVMVHIRHIREKMKDSAENPKYIKTVWGVGYKIG